MLAALHVLAALAETDGTASELLAGHDPYPSSGEINSEVPDPAAALERVREHTEKLPDAVADELDGLTVEIGRASCRKEGRAGGGRGEEQEEEGEGESSRGR